MALPPTRTRRQPPPFRPVVVQRVEHLSPRLVRVSFAGPGLDGLAGGPPAASVRLLIPWPRSSGLAMPVWAGNEFLLPDGRRPAIRTFTPLSPRTISAGTGGGPAGLDLDIVLHGEGAASQWAAGATGGEPAAVSGPGRGYTVDGAAPAFCLAGDETAIPAMSQLLESIPAGVPVQVHIEVADPVARLTLPDHRDAVVHWHDLPAGAAPGDALVAAVARAPLVAGCRVWVAGEAAAVQRIRRHLFEERAWPRAQATVRGYWKHGRAGDTDVDT